MHRSDKLFALGFVTAIILVGSSTAYLASAPKTDERFTEFYILGSNGMMADYPVNLTLGQNGTVTIGITNHEYMNMTYKVNVSLENRTLAIIDNIQLVNGERWSQNYTFVPDKTGDRMNLEFKLYTQNSDGPYNNLRLWVTVQ
jgi:uncharacterized membrane protein